MKHLLSLAWLTAMAALLFSQTAQAQRADYEAMVATHAQANGVPAELVHPCPFAGMTRIRFKGSPRSLPCRSGSSVRYLSSSSELPSEQG